MRWNNPSNVSSLTIRKTLVKDEGIVRASSNTGYPDDRHTDKRGQIIRLLTSVFRLLVYTRETVRFISAVDARKFERGRF